MLWPLILPLQITFVLLAVILDARCTGRSAMPMLPNAAEPQAK